jgi:hypothetical protein
VFAWGHCRSSPLRQRKNSDSEVTAR